MRVVLAPDKFAGTMSAVQVTQAVSSGWRRHAPNDQLVAVPMSDGGAGFVDVLAATLDGELVTVPVSGPYYDHGKTTVDARYLRVGGRAYIESAAAAGLHLTEPSRRRATVASSYGVGELMAHAIASGATELVVGLGGSGTNDGGLGLLLALGAQADVDPARGPSALAEATHINLEPALVHLADVRLVTATDVMVPLLGITGATKTFGPQKGLNDEEIFIVDGWLRRLAELTDRKLAELRGTGAAGGMGFALQLLGGQLRSGVEVVAEAVSLEQQLVDADLVITGEGAVDFTTGSGKVPFGVAEFAAAAIAPCIIVAGEVLVSDRELRALGVETAYSLTERFGAERALGEPMESLADLGERIAQTWSRL